MYAGLPLGFLSPGKRVSPPGTKFVSTPGTVPGKIHSPGQIIFTTGHFARCPGSKGSPACMCGVVHVFNYVRVSVACGDCVVLCVLCCIVCICDKF